MKTEINARFDKVAARTKENCSANSSGQCDSDLKSVADRHQQELTAPENKRQAVKIG